MTFFMLSFHGTFYCESRQIIYDEPAKPVLSVFLNFLIKRVDVFYKWLSISCHAGPRKN